MSQDAFSRKDFAQLMNRDVFSLTVLAQLLKAPGDECIQLRLAEMATVVRLDNLL